MNFYKMHGLKNDYIFFDFIKPENQMNCLEKIIEPKMIEKLWSEWRFEIRNFKPQK
jgi:diaminopimelate epimerase